MPVSLKRAYADPVPEDGYRVLVDGLWPRGLSKADCQIQEWKKHIAPSRSLRQRFHAGALSWGDFRRRYLAELKHHREELRDLARRAGEEQVTLVFAASDREHNNAVVVKQYLAMLKAP
jgi:uncharacterized protein YeaO (DUF488 family)